MRKIISFMHLSLDGFVAGPNGEMDWIKVDEEIFDHVGKRISKTDTALYGRINYQMMESYWTTAADQPTASKHDREHAAWYTNAHKVVLSQTLQGATLANTTIISNPHPESINELKKSSEGGSNEILLFGSPIATHALMQQNLLDGYWLFVNPVLLDKGIPLFAATNGKVPLKLVSTRPFACGVTELNYVVAK